eukprot:SAG31_NODE_2174_length_6257_cov_1.750244_6_plen_155_part_00
MRAALTGDEPTRRAIRSRNLCHVQVVQPRLLVCQDVPPPARDVGCHAVDGRCSLRGGRTAVELGARATDPTLVATAAALDTAAVEGAVLVELTAGRGGCDTEQEEGRQHRAVHAPVRAAESNVARPRLLPGPWLGWHPPARRARCMLAMLLHNF